MKNIVIIEKNGDIKQQRVQTIVLNDLYKKCKFRKPDSFEKRATWNNSGSYVSLYAKDEGRAGSENKYDLPPPLDSKLYFGSMVLVKHENENIDDNNVLSFTKDEWLSLYEKLFGGFTDLGNEDSESDDVEEIPEEFKTKHGYSKEDGFVVDDADSLVFEEDDDDEEDDYFEDSDSDEEDEDEEAVYGVESDNDDCEKEDSPNENEEDDSDEELSCKSESELSESDYLSD